MTLRTGSLFTRILSGGAMRRAVPAIAWLAALGFTAWVGATLFWRFSAPEGATLPIRTDTDPRATAQRIIGQQLLGGRPTLASGATTPGPALPVEVVGLATGFEGGSGFVILKSGGKLTTFTVGDEISPGRKLQGIFADRIRIERDGTTEEIRLPVASLSGIVPSGGEDAPPQPLRPEVPPQDPEQAARAALYETEKD